ncbi:uncharacterized protein JN550_007535 [Neoarthrinium moseri]|uniref:uncharacterized protein n=1 Tax=Neoarthrinium moseri TaxID=1658444 RepID=UPI001FDBBF59|nr:uncharacterized protein JN550_007535 [Neoarthrinium moseri]KAI1866682.1 hypothetical protein JN550_007535 [Neoarthrinium moseri]
MASSPEMAATEKIRPLSPSITPLSSTAMGSTDVEKSETALKKSISNRQFIFMAMGGSIGAGLLIASSTALQVGGPGALLMGFLIVGIAVTLTMGSLGELAATFPVAGSFYDYSVQFISPSWGFSMGWNYILNFLLIVPFEVTVMTLVTKYWNTDLNSAILIPIFLIALFAIAACGAKWYAEAEHFFGILKVAVLVGFSITAVIIAAGGVSTDDRHGTGFSYWQDGKAFQGGATGFLWVFVAAGLAYGGTEMLGLTVAECKHPQKVMPLAFKIVSLRILFCYLLPLFTVGLVIGADTFKKIPLGRVSPFVLATRAANIPVLPDIINAIILIAVFSMASASIFASSRALRAICDNGMGPRLLAKTTKSGLPLNSLLVVLAVSMIAFINAAPKGETIFDWLLALASASNFFTWLSINVAQIRLRLAIKKQGKDINEVLVWKSPAGIWGSMLAIAIALAGLLSLLITALIPPKGLSSSDTVGIIFVRHVLGFIVVGAMWLVHMAVTWNQTPHPLLIPLKDIKLSKEETVAAAQE